MISLRRSKWRADRLVQFSEQLANLLEAGFSLIPSIRLLGEQNILRFQEMEGILQRLEEGRGLSSALSEEGLPPIFVSFLSAAEEHGDYAFGLRQCRSYFQGRDQLIRDTVQALMYPAIVLILVGCAFVFLVTTVVPRFQAMYATMGLELPLYTRWFLSFHQWIREGVYFIGGVTLFIMILFLFLRHLSPVKRQQLMAWVYQLPVLRSYFALRFTHYLAVQLGSLLKAGVPLLRAVEIVEGFSPWAPLTGGMKSVRHALLAGHSLHESLSKEGSLFLKSLRRLVALGEETGSLDQSLLTLARGTEMIIRERMNRFTRSLEPILIFGLGVLMAATVLAMFLPMLHMVQAM
ncbi:type II secretion system F family protein [Marininema halotolerans]|nr:type II secretion system F family protein [Marininema halotolerans]